MSDPNDDLGSVADSGVPDDPEPGDRGEARCRHRQPGFPGQPGGTARLR
jgi:hypothetical protein